MDKYAVVGNPIAHSKSPTIHAMFAKQTEQVMEYGAMLSQTESFEKDISHFFETQGLGLNITVPFKLQACQFANRLSERASHAGAVNTLIKKDNIIIGENTDGCGLVNDITKNNNFDLTAKRILIIGAGGASRGVILPLLEQKPSSITIVNRTQSKAQELAKSFSKKGRVEVLSFDELKTTEPFDLIINASSAGLSGEMPDIPNELPIQNCFCYDMVYGKDNTTFINWALSKGCLKACDGLGMLVEQAAESFYLWRGVRPDTKNVLKELRAEIT
jgi:shikimate dehydrogenase